ncbi:uncharacterized protein LOC128249497 [Octopus bimaculoides]|uniref:uncharacterized protein LOC128249497 n=1 Tax=Octopus bimaculoides TaxID=37653 RepID=UPI0022DF7E7E|nr:uncharacterized protein LOC128249497 [Octopus bimaculoides]XP_052829130.1 uncharacterized protein LOC128249497 [Octopus bimaculoides]
MASRQSSKASASSEVPFQGTSGELIKISEFIESWKQMSEYDLGTVRSEKHYIQDAMDLNDSDYYRQAVNCSDQLLYSGDEIKARFPCLNIFTDDVKLMSVKLQELDVKQRNADPLYKRNVLLPQKSKILDVELVNWFSFFLLFFVLFFFNFWMLHHSLLLYGVWLRLCLCMCGCVCVCVILFVLVI